MNIFTGFRVLEEADSPINGHIRVVKDLAWGIHIQAEGLTQSGGVVEGIWRSTLRKISHEPLTINHCLILGLGGGTAAKLVRKFWPNSEIVGVDIDPTIVEMGRKYLELDKAKVQVKIQDASNFLTTCYKLHTTFDLILVDLYVGHKVPKKFETRPFLDSTRSLLAESGVAVFSRLYYGERRPETMKFGEKLQKVFSKVEYHHPKANIMFICSS